MAGTSGNYGVCSLLQHVVLVMAGTSGNYGVCSLLQHVVLVMAVTSGNYGICCPKKVMLSEKKFLL